MSTPYNWQLGLDDARLFRTDFGLTYRVYFLRGEDYFSGVPEISHLVRSFGFEIRENPHLYIPPDPKVGFTICAIILQYFELNPLGILFFIHESADGKQHGRKRKFDQWFHKQSENSLIKRDALIPIGRFSIPVSLIFRQAHPQNSKILDGFDRLVLEATEKPEDLYE